MDPVRTEDCNVVYKGPNEQIGDLWCHRVQPGLIRVTYEPNEAERELLKAGGRVQLFILREPISPVSLEVVSKEESEPVAPHGWKIDKTPGDKLNEEEDVGGEEKDEKGKDSEDLSWPQDGTTPRREASDTIST